MRKQTKRKIRNEGIWLIGIGTVAAVLEYAIIELLDLHPVLNIKIQGFIGLLVFAYVIRIAARVWKPSEKES